MNATKINTAKTYLTRSSRSASLFAACLLLAAAVGNNGFAYPRYNDAGGSCFDCHGKFTENVSPKGTTFPSGDKHAMHNGSSSMNTACNLCHTSGDGRNPFIKSSTGTANNAGLGCTGCHVAEGLRKHHAISGVTECYDCHDPNEVSAPENVKPPYYGTIDTKVKNPGNTLLVANTNENWSVGDFIGLDNDGNNLYDLADYAIGPFQVLSLTPAGNNLSVKWLTAAGRTNWLQAAGTVAGAYANVSPAIAITNVGNVGLVTNTYVEINGATNATRFYRMKGSIP